MQRNITPVIELPMPTKATVAIPEDFRDYHLVLENLESEVEAERCVGRERKGESETSK